MAQRKSLKQNEQHLYNEIPVSTVSYCAESLIVQIEDEFGKKLMKLDSIKLIVRKKLNLSAQ